MAGLVSTRPPFFARRMANIADESYPGRPVRKRSSRFGRAGRRVPSPSDATHAQSRLLGPRHPPDRPGKGFSFHEEDGERITDEATLDRIRALAIPPAWKDVWICPDPRGHIQATGTDDAGRKQYRYHDDWRAHRDRAKFEEMEDFAKRLPKLRERIAADLEAERGLVFDRTCSCAVALLDLGLFRIGSERYETENESYGLTTLKCKHLTFKDGAAVFDYPSKSGQRALQQISDPSVRPTLQALKKRGQARRGPVRLARGPPSGATSPPSTSTRSSRRSPATATAPRTSAPGTRPCSARPSSPSTGRTSSRGPSKSARKRLINLAVRETANYLGNTPAVCRASYIDPRVFDRFDSGDHDPQVAAADRARRRSGHLPRARAHRARRPADALSPAAPCAGAGTRKGALLAEERPSELVVGLRRYYRPLGWRTL